MHVTTSPAFAQFMRRTLESVPEDQPAPPCWQVGDSTFAEFAALPEPLRELIEDQVRAAVLKVSFVRGRYPRASWARVAREARTLLRRTN